MVVKINNNEFRKQQMPRGGHLLFSEFVVVVVIHRSTRKMQSWGEQWYT